MSLYGQDMDESVTPPEAGLGWTVAMKDDRDFIGRDALQSRAPRFQMLGLVLRDKGVLRAHQKLRSAHGAGEITSGTFSPTLGCSIALARVADRLQPGRARRGRDPRAVAAGRNSKIPVRQDGPQPAARLTRRTLHPAWRLP